MLEIGAGLNTGPDVALGVDSPLRGVLSKAANVLMGELRFQ
jgi:hypothetical protein